MRDDDFKKLVTAGLLYKLFTGNRSAASSPIAPPPPGYRPRLFRRWLLCLVILVSIPLLLLELRYAGDGAFYVAGRFDLDLDEEWGFFLGLVGLLYLCLVAWFVLWTFFVVLRWVIVFLVFLFRLVF